MIVDIETRRLRTIAQLRAFVEGTEAMDYQLRERDEAYGFVRDTLGRFAHGRLGRRDRGAVLRFLVAATGISRPQVERLARQWRHTGDARPGYTAIPHGQPRNQDHPIGLPWQHRQTVEQTTCKH